MFPENLQVYKFISLIFITYIISNVFQNYINIWSDEFIGIIEYNSPQAEIKRESILNSNKFPDSFHFGATISAYECEGAWNVTDKSESVWDHMTHSNPNLISDRTNGDVSSDFYHMYAKDIELASSIKITMIKISLSWTRILPNSYNNYVSQSGILFYNKVINEMLINNITPMVSLFDGDMPYYLQQLGGWTNPIMVDIFVDYAKIAFTSFGDRVKYWATINDPVKMCRYGYGGTDIPAMNISGIADYLCGHHVLLAHAKVYELYHQEYNSWKNNRGKIGILNYYTWFVPEKNTSEHDIEAAERTHKFYNDWLTYPIFSQTGDYPDIMKTRIGNNSYTESFSSSRLPAFSSSEIERIRGSADFLGINYYTATSVEDYSDNTRVTSFDKDAGIRRVETTRWYGEDKIKNTPWGLTKLLHRLNDDYSLPELWITGNGYADFGDNIDIDRVIYHHEHLKAILKAMQDGINIQGYLAKSLIDGFEEMNGYKIKFGLFGVDFNDSKRTRSDKLSKLMINDIFERREIRPLDQIYEKQKFEKLDAKDVMKIIVHYQQWSSKSYPAY